jgi:hypothetical protein
LCEAQVYGEDRLCHAVVEFPSDAAALLVLKLEQLRGKLMDGFFRIFQYGDIGEGGDDPEDGAVGVELRDGVTENPQEFRHAGTPPTHCALPNGHLGAKNGGDGQIRERNFAPLIIDGN